MLMGTYNSSAVNLEIELIGRKLSFVDFNFLLKWPQGINFNDFSGSSLKGKGLSICSKQF